MREHDEVIRAWLDGKNIQFKKTHGVEWVDFPKDLVTNPMTFSALEWRTKPELKKVDYQVLIDSKLLVAFTDPNGCYSGHSVISRLTKISNDNLYMDDSGVSWSEIIFEEGLMQVVPQKTATDLYNAGFKFGTVFGNYSDYYDDVFDTIILKGVRKGYTL